MDILIKLLACILLLPLILTVLGILLPFILFLIILSLFIPSIHPYARFQTIRGFASQKKSKPETDADVCDVECVVLDSEKVDDSENAEKKYLKEDL